MAESLGLWSRRRNIEGELAPERGYSIHDPQTILLSTIWRLYESGRMETRLVNLKISWRRSRTRPGIHSGSTSTSPITAFRSVGAKG